jgi:cobalt-zinc-cadmium efflux system outer membrane protein
MGKFVVVLWSAAALAQQAGPLKLEELRQEALRSNPEVLAAQKRVEAARQRPSQESSLPDPTLSLGYNSTGSPRPFAGVGTDPVANAGVMVSQEFPFPGKRKLRGEVATREADAEFQQYRMVERNVVSRTEQAYHRLHHNYVMRDLVERNRDLLRKILRVTEARYSVGKAAQQDAFKAQTQLSVLETRNEKLRQERGSIEAEINALLNRSLETPVGRPEDENPQPMKVTLAELMKAVREDAPMLRREQKVMEGAESALNLARKDYYPDYTVSAGYYTMGAMRDMYMARVDFKLPAWFGRKQRAAVAEKSNLLGQARHDYEAANNTLSFRVKDDYLMAETSYRLMQMYSTTVIPQSRLALESSLASYQTGAVDFSQALLNFTATLEYEMNYHEEMMSYFLAVARLKEMTGVEP